MKTLCYSVRLSSFVEISDKCYKAVGFDGSESLIPKSQYFGIDYDVQKSEAHWISSWILEKKDLVYSQKKKAWFNSDTGRMEPHFEIETHEPTPIAPVESKPHGDLTK
jgi:hypothetical protein